MDGQTERSKWVGAHESIGKRMSFKTVVLLGAAALWCVPCLANAQSADERLRAIYTEEWKWRLEQFPGLEGIEKPVPDRLSKVDSATQEMRLRYWQDVRHKLDAGPRAPCSPPPAALAGGADQPRCLSAGDREFRRRPELP